MATVVKVRYHRLVRTGRSRNDLKSSFDNRRRSHQRNTFNNLWQKYIFTSSISLLNINICLSWEPKSEFEYRYKNSQQSRAGFKDVGRHAPGGSVRKYTSVLEPSHSEPVFSVSVRHDIKSVWDISVRISVFLREPALYGAHGTIGPAVWVQV